MPERFNEAPIRESGKSDWSGESSRRRAASMRPRFANRGSQVARSAGIVLRPASMRPRFANRGSA